MALGFSGPLICNGNNPLLLKVCTSNCGNTSLKKDKGRLTRLPVPVTVIGLSLSAAIDVNIRTDKPLSPQLMVSEIGLTPLLSITIVSLVYSIVAPNCCMIFNAALSSAELPGLCKIVLPLFTRAAAQALCIALLEVGAMILPLMSDGFMVTCIINFRKVDQLKFFR